MAEPLKNSFGPGVPTWIAGEIKAVYDDFNQDRFLESALDGYDALELTPRARQIADALAEHLPADRGKAMELIVESLGPEIEGTELGGMDSFRYLPYVFFVADHGLDDYETAMRAQYELTKRLSAEFSIRAYLEHYPEETLSRLETWATDDNVHVRRLVSEGTRPRLPWAPRLRIFQDDPTPVLRLLEMLKDDPEEYVRRSVANSLNDIAKDHADRILETARRWWGDGDENRQRLVRHALRTLIKAGNLEALAILGYGPDSPIRVLSAQAEPSSLRIGETARLTVVLDNPSRQQGAALVDLIVHFVKADGKTSPKVFKGGERALGPAETATVSKTVSLAQRTTRTHYPGLHRFEVQMNGRVWPGGEFQVEQG